MKKILVCAMLAMCFVTGCNGSLKKEVPVPTEIDEQEVPYSENVDTSLDAEEYKRVVSFSNDGAGLKDENSNVICGPFKFIYENDIPNYNYLCRFIGANGLIGYLNYDTGEVVVEPQFTDAAKFEDGAACVYKAGECYYIDKNGERFTFNDYLYGYPFSETQGTLARVQFSDGSWGIIDREENVLINGCDKINKLPLVGDIGSGVKDGHAVLIKTHDVEGGFPKNPILATYSEFSDISEVYWDEYAVVQTPDGYSGVVCSWTQDVILPAVYESVECMVYPEEENWHNCFYFYMKLSSGIYETYNWDPHKRK